MKIHKPILAYGTFGLHILDNPTGTYSYFGTIPEQLHKIIGQTYQELLEKFFDWLDGCSVADRKECVPLLRSDVFVQYLNRRADNA